MTGRSLLDLTVRELLDAVAARTSAPGGGAVAALTTALAAGLTGMAARYGIPRAPVPDGPCATSIRAQQLRPGELHAIAQRADELRERVAALADADAGAYAAFLAAQRLTSTDPTRPGAIASTGERAAAVPGEIAEIGDAVSELALSLRHRGNPNLDGDVIAAVLLAAAATTAAARIVEENVGHSPRDPRIAGARALMIAASQRTYGVLEEQQQGRP